MTMSEQMHYLHAQHLIEKARSDSILSNKNTHKKPQREITNKNIVLLIYMSRNNPHPLIFSSGWKHLFLDAVLPSKHKLYPQIQINDINAFDSKGNDQKQFISRVQNYINIIISKGFMELFDDVTVDVNELKRIKQLLNTDLDKGALKKVLIRRLKNELDTVPFPDANINILKRSLVSVKNSIGSVRTQVTSDLVQNCQELVSCKNTFTQLIELIFCNGNSKLYFGKQHDSQLSTLWLELLSEPKICSIDHIGATTCDVKFPFSSHVHAYVSKHKNVLLGIWDAERMSDEDQGYTDQHMLAMEIRNKLNAANLFVSLDNLSQTMIRKLSTDVAVLECTRMGVTKNPDSIFNAFVQFIDAFLWRSINDVHKYMLAERKLNADLETSKSIHDIDKMKVQRKIRKVCECEFQHYETVPPQQLDPDTLNLTYSDKKHIIQCHPNLHLLLQYKMSEADMDAEPPMQAIGSNDGIQEQIRQFQTIQIYEIYASLWANETIILQLVDLLSMFKDYPIILNQVNKEWDNAETLEACLSRVVATLFDKLHHLFTEKTKTHYFKNKFNNLMLRSTKFDGIFTLLQKFDLDVVSRLRRKCLSIIDLPLHQFTVEDIYNKIKLWVCNDINYKAHLEQTKQILSKTTLTGHIISGLSLQHVKRMLQNDLLAFITQETLKIIFVCFDEWKSENNVTSKSPEEIGHIIFNFPLNKLLKRILDDKIDGKKFIDYYLTNQQFIKHETGWEDSEIEQVEAMLFKCQSVTQKIFENHMNVILSTKYNNIPVSVRTKITEVLLNCNVDEIYFNIKNGKNIQSFADIIINMVIDIDAESDGNLIEQIFLAVAECFVFTHESDKKDISLAEQLQWRCFNCTNFNFHNVIGSKQNMDLSICSLCGVKQIDSITIKLKSNETFAVVNDNDIDDNTEYQQDNKQDNKQDDIDAVVQVLSKDDIDLSCVTTKNQKPCESLLCIAKYLKQYQQWLHTIEQNTNGAYHVNQTIEVDIEKFVNDDLFKTIFNESMKSIHVIVNNKAKVKLLTTLVDDSKMFANKNEFLRLDKISFIKQLQKYANILPSDGDKLHQLITKKMKRTAQTMQFGKFLSDVDINILDKHYYHILNCHINHGNQTSVKNAFIFFQNVIKCDQIKINDNNSKQNTCISWNRREQRVAELHAQKRKDENDAQNSVNKSQKTNIWSLKQYYTQMQLDTMHCYLSHSNWTVSAKQYAKSTDENENKVVDVKTINENTILQNKNKYITDLTGSHITDYRFGFDHSHPYLHPVHYSIRDEILRNKLFALHENRFQQLLVKAIKLHKIALGENFENILICKYFDPLYNILRNEPIGIRHILAIIIYTDMTDFCTAFRSTYRKINNETNADQVVERHQELYRYARALFESVELFGQRMSADLTVYHGLNKVMYFEEFTAWFNQPISTTMSFTTAYQFSEGCGIILSLKSAIQNFDDLTVPKYLSVSWLSLYPGEDEKLFYSAHVRFQIANIHNFQQDELTGHATELLLLNKFQQLVKGHPVIWDETDEEQSNMISDLVSLLKYQQSANRNQQIENKQSNETPPLQWKPTDVVCWLKRIGMEKYENNFMEESVDGEMLLNDITKENLKTDLYVKSIHTSKIIREINKLRENRDISSNIKSDEKLISKTNVKEEDEKYESESKWNYMTKYGIGLFGYFCNNQNTKEIFIRNYKSLPQKLHTALFNETMSLIPIVDSFKYVSEIAFCDLKVHEMAAECKLYVEAVLEYIKTYEQIFGIKIKKIVFQSEIQNGRKTNSTLRNLANRNMDKFRHLQWRIAYRLDAQNIHDLSFTNNK
eukprot:293997_1